MIVNAFRVFWPSSASKIQGLVRFRWLALACLIVGVIPLLMAGYLQKEQMPYLFAVLALLGVFNGLTQGIWSNPTPAQEERLIFVQLLVDLLAAAGLLFVTGSANNPFIFVLMVHAFMGGMLLRRSKSFVFITLIAVLLSILQLETYQDAQVTVGVDQRELSFGFLSQWILTFVSWFVAYLFSELMQRQETRIRNLQEKQLKADRLKSLGALTAGFSHQMATPLNALKLRMERAARKSTAQPEVLAELSEAAQALDECVVIFQQMSGVFSNSTDGELQKVKVKSLLRDVVKAWEQDNPDVQVQTHFHEDDCHCHLQPLAFSNTVFDLLDNAAEASGANAKISLRLHKSANQLVFEVIDSGKGLSAEILSRLGEPFATDKIHGNGLGIYTAHMTAQSMGGEFEIFNNSTGRGVTARLIFPQGDVL